MNEKAKCNKVKGYEFKNNKQKISLFKSLEKQSFQMTIEIIWVNKSPWSSLCGFSWNEYQKFRA